MRWAGFLVLVMSGCGSESAPEAAGEIGWRFNYKDWTNTSATDLLRDCANEPAVNSGPPYSAVTSVRIAVEDPEGQVQGIDRDETCDVGSGGHRARLVGLTPEHYTLNLEAKSAAGTVLYRLTKTDYDLSQFVSVDEELPTVTGELHFFPTYNGSLDCPAGVTGMRYILYAQDDNGTPLPDPAVTGVLTPACEDNFGTMQSRELYIREIPVSIDTASGQTVNFYKLRLEALDSGNVVTHCVTNANRPVKLGDASLGGNESLAAGSACP